MHLVKLVIGVSQFSSYVIYILIYMIHWVQADVKWPNTMSRYFKVVGTPFLSDHPLLVFAQDFLQGLLVKDPQQRLSWPHLLRHPFVSEGVDLEYLQQCAEEGLHIATSRPPSPTRIQTAPAQVYPSCLSVCLSVCLPACLSVCLSVLLV